MSDVFLFVLGTLMGLGVSIVVVWVAIRLILRRNFGDSEEKPQ